MTDYGDLVTHDQRCDAKMAALEQTVVDLRAEVAGLKDGVRKLGIIVSKLGDAIGDFNTHVEGDWHLNE